MDFGEPGLRVGGLQISNCRLRIANCKLFWRAVAEMGLHRCSRTQRGLHWGSAVRQSGVRARWSQGGTGLRPDSHPGGSSRVEEITNGHPAPTACTLASAVLVVTSSPRHPKGARHPRGARLRRREGGASLPQTEMEVHVVGSTLPGNSPTPPTRWRLPSPSVRGGRYAR